MDIGRDDSLSRIPVFVHPASVTFNANDRDHLKQILTIYNPYEFPILFKVLSTTPLNYTVVDPEGHINAKNSVDLIIRLTSTVPAEVSSNSISDKFRVQIWNANTRILLGRKDVPSTINFGSPTSSLLSGNYSQGSGLNSVDMTSFPSEFQQCPSSGIISSSSVKSEQLGGGPGMGTCSSTGGGSQHYHPNYVAVLTGLVCIIGLMLPTNTNDREGETSNSSSSFPSYLHLSINFKLLIAYTLGLVTMVIFRPQ